MRYAAADASGSASCSAARPFWWPWGPHHPGVAPGRRQVETSHDQGRGGEERRAETRPVKLGLHLNDPRASRATPCWPRSIRRTPTCSTCKGGSCETWESDCKPGHCAYLLENGHLLRAGLDRQRHAASSARAGRRRADPGVHLGRRAGLGLQVLQREAASAPRHDAAAQRQRAADRLGPQDRRGGDRRRPPAGDDRRPAPGARLARRDQADRQDHRRGRVGVAPLGPPGPGLRQDQGELRQRRRAPRAGRHQLRRRRAPPPMVAKPRRSKDKLAGRSATSAAPTGKPARIDPDWTHVNAVAYNADWIRSR